MKIITILSLYITASLSLAHSTLSYKERGDAFAYDYSEICANDANCDLILVNRIPQNINLWLDTLRYPTILSSAPPETFLPQLPSRVTAANYFGFASETDQNIHFYYHPLEKFSSQADANAFTYDYSGLCADIPNCYPSMKNLPEIDNNSQFPPMPLRIGESVSTCGASFGSNFSFVIAGADGRQIINSNKKIDEYETIYNKYSALGFSSETYANAYLNILDPIPSPQISSLGSLRSIIFGFNISINQDASIIEIQQNQYMLGFGAKKVKQLGQIINPKLLNIFTIQQLQDSRDQVVFAQPYIIIPKMFKVSKDTTIAFIQSLFAFTSSNTNSLANEFRKCSHPIQPFMNITQQPNNQLVFARKFTLLYEYANKKLCPQVFQLNFIYLIPIQTPSKIYAQTNPDGSYNIVNQNKNEEQAFICPKIPDEIRSITDLEKTHGCQQFKLAPSNSIEIKLKE